MVTGVVFGLDVVTLVVMVIITLLTSLEWLEFVVVMDMIIVTLGAYWVPFVPEDISEERRGNWSW